MSFQIVPLPQSIADQARQTGRAPGYGHAVQASVAASGDYGPCRCCLRRTREGETRLLMSYNPYPEAGEVKVVGPVFIHEERCRPFAGDGFPEELRGLPMVLQGHLRDGAGLLNRKVDAAAPESAIEDLLGDPRIAFVTIRNAEAGCFIAKAVRAGEPA